MNRITVLSFLLTAPILLAQSTSTPSQPALGHRSVPVINVDGLQFKDLNRNGKLDPYEDWRLPAADRARDLISRMTLEEMAGLMVHGTLPTAAGAPGSNAPGAGTAGYDLARANPLLTQSLVSSFITRLSGAPAFLATENNRIQELAESTRVGVPVTISTDPRNHFRYVQGASVQPGAFSRWPETTGLAAIGDPALARKFADIARQEHIAVGIRETLSPQADLATEPRWARINGTFGEDADFARRLLKAYAEGFQNGGDGLNPGSVIAVVKHWVGYGAQKDGWDSHNYYGRFASFPGNNFEYHITPYLGAFEAQVGGVMPVYSILQGVTIDGKPLEQVAGGFNTQLLQDLLRMKYGFKGVVVSDWGITSDCQEHCRDGFPAGQKPDFRELQERISGMPWGVEDLTRSERFVKAINAGVDQIGDSEEPEFITAAVRAGKITEARVRESAQRILEQKFAIGLFENPYADPAAATAIVGNADFVAQARAAQQCALVLLENKGHLLPIKDVHHKVWVFGLDPAAVTKYGFTVVDSPDKADFAIIRADSPSESEHPGYIFGQRQGEGRLDFRDSDPAYAAILKASAHVPVILTVKLDRPAILTNVKDKTAALIANFGIDDTALLDVLSGKARPEGHLPFELPSSVEAVKAQKSDVPHDSANPLYPFGFGLSY
jgi:beta-glucosidase